MNKLQKALISNAIFSSVSGVLLILLNHRMAELFGTDNNTVFWIVGLMLVFFALTIVYEVRKQRKPAVMWIIIQDFAWVLGSAILILFNPFEITLTGNILIGIIALIVSYMGMNQLIALKQYDSLQSIKTQ